jgi:hypothetical protein
VLQNILPHRSGHNASADWKNGDPHRKIKMDGVAIVGFFFKARLDFVDQHGEWPNL